MLLAIAAVIHLSLWLYIITAARPQEAIVPLHYNIYFGIDLFAEWYKIYALPISGAVILLINSLAAVTFLRKEKILTATAVIGTLLMEAALIASTYLIFSEIYYS